MRTVIARLLPALLALVSNALAQGATDPRTYHSPSGSWAFDVMPLLHRRGPTRYRLFRGRECVMDVEREFTLTDVVVSETGIAFGHEYVPNPRGGCTPPLVPWSERTYGVFAFSGSGGTEWLDEKKNRAVPVRLEVVECETSVDLWLHFKGAEPACAFVRSSKPLERSVPEEQRFYSPRAHAVHIDTVPIELEELRRFEIEMPRGREILRTDSGAFVVNLAPDVWTFDEEGHAELVPRVWTGDLGRVHVGHDGEIYVCTSTGLWEVSGAEPVFDPVPASKRAVLRSSYDGALWTTRSWLERDGEEGLAGLEC